VRPAKRPEAPQKRDPWDIALKILAGWLLYGGIVVIGLVLTRPIVVAFVRWAGGPTHQEAPGGPQ
jgi:hypothetical protein